MISNDSIRLKPRAFFEKIVVTKTSEIFYMRKMDFSCTNLMLIFFFIYSFNLVVNSNTYTCILRDTLL